MFPGAIIPTCDFDWGRPVVLKLWVLLMLKLRLCEEVRVWVGAIRSNRSAEGVAEAGAGAAAGAGVAIMAPKRSFPLASTDWGDDGICPPGKAFHSPNSPLLLETATRWEPKRQFKCTFMYLPFCSIFALWTVVNNYKQKSHKQNRACHSSLEKAAEFSRTTFIQASLSLTTCATL